MPIDSFVSRGIELLNSIPRLLLIITVSSVVARSIWIVMVIIGLTRRDQYCKIYKSRIFKNKITGICTSELNL